MRTRRLLAAIVGSAMALTLAGAAFAAVSFTQADQLPIDLAAFSDNNSDAACTQDVLDSLDPGEALVHFVMNQVTLDGVAPEDVELTVTFTSGEQTNKTSANNQGTLHWEFIADATDDLTSVDAVDADGNITVDGVTEGQLQLSHVCIKPLPPTSTIDQTPASPAGNSLGLVLGLIALVAGGAAAYTMRSRFSTR